MAKGRIPLSGYGANQLARLRRGFNALKGSSTDFNLGTGTAAYTLANDADITGAATVAALRAEVLKINQFVRARAEEDIGKGLVNEA